MLVKKGHLARGESEGRACCSPAQSPLATVLRIIPMLLVMGMIFYLSHQPADELRLPAFPCADKVAHLLAYGLLAFTVIIAFSHKFMSVLGERRFFSLVVVFCLLYGISDEFHQSFIAGRQTSVADLAADLLGAVLCCLIFAAVSPFLLRNR